MSTSLQAESRIRNYNHQIDTIEADIRILEERVQFLEEVCRKKEQEEMDVDSLFSVLNTRAENIDTLGCCNMTKYIAVALKDKLALLNVTEIKKCYSETRKLVKDAIDDIEYEIEEKTRQIRRLNYQIEVERYAGYEN